MELLKYKGDYRHISVTPVIARVFEKTIFRSHAQEAIQNTIFLPRSFLTLRKGGNCTGALSATQHRINSYLDNPDSKEVPVFTMDFSKAFDSVKNDLLAVKLKKLPLNPHIVN